MVVVDPPAEDSLHIELPADDALIDIHLPCDGEIRFAAMDLLARREHGFDELQNKLFIRFTKRLPVNIDTAHFRPAIAAQVEKLRSEGLQSDERLVEAYVRARSNKGHGPSKIRQELTIKGISSVLIYTALNTDEINWLEVLKGVASKKYGKSSMNSTLDMRMRAKRNRFLLQRGFAYDLIAELDRQ